MGRYKKWFIGSLLISAISIALVTCLTYNSETIEALREIRLEYILGAVLLHAFSYLIWGLRIRALCKALGHRIGILKVTEIVISSTFVAGITPSSAGGEFLRVHSLNRNRIPTGRATAIVVGERLLDAIFIFSSLPFAFYIFGDVLSDYKFDAVFLTANLLVFVIFVLVIYGVWKPQKMKHITRRISGKLAPFFGKKTDTAISHLMEQIDREIDHFHDSVRIFFSEGKKGLLWGIFYTFIFWTLEYTARPGSHGPFKYPFNSNRLCSPGSSGNHNDNTCNPRGKRSCRTGSGFYLFCFCGFISAGDYGTRMESPDIPHESFYRRDN